MAITSEQVVVAECNNCGKREYSDDGDFAGVRGTVIDPHNGAQLEWYSCVLTAGHIGKAVRAALNDEATCG